MPLIPRRHIRNRLKPTTFKLPPNLEVHMISATRVNGQTIHIEMSGPIQSGISMSDFYFGEAGNGILWNGNLTVISGGPFTGFDVSFSSQMGVDTACDNSGFVICNVSSSYAVGSGITLRQPDVVPYAGL